MREREREREREMIPPIGIRKKLMRELMVMLVLMAAFTLIIIYNEQKIHHEIDRFMHEHEEMQLVSNLQLAMSNTLMPANDYIITGDISYLKEFNDSAVEMEKIIAKIRLSMQANDEFAEVPGEQEVKKEAITAWNNIKAFSLKIFEVKKPVGDKTAIALMKEMDYKYAYPVIKKLEKWQSLEQLHMHAAEESLAALTHSTYTSTILSSFTVALAGVIFTLVYSKRFTSAIKTLSTETTAIAMGDFKRRITLDTNDELENLASAINRMSSELEASYSQLEGKIAERTKELTESEEELKQKVDELERFRKATLKREVRMKELREKLKELEGRGNAEEV